MACRSIVTWDFDTTGDGRRSLADLTGSYRAASSMELMSPLPIHNFDVDVLQEKLISEPPDYPSVPHKY